MKITICQLNPIVGDIEGNLSKIKSVFTEKTNDIAVENNTDLVIFSELFLTGYPPRDLLLKKYFIEKVINALDDLKKFSKKHPKTGILVGTPYPVNYDNYYKIYNSAVLIYNGKIIFTYHKVLLSNHDVFDESRYFQAAENIEPFKFKGEILAVTIGEETYLKDNSAVDIGNAVSLLSRAYFDDVDIIINISASPFHINKEKSRYNIIEKIAEKYRVPYVFVNQVGGNDELIFDGRSFCLDSCGNVFKTLPSFIEKSADVDLDKKNKNSQGYLVEEKIEKVYKALILGIKDYVHKCGFKKAVVSLSGGIDSAVVCTLASTALGAENVLAVTMPGPYSSIGSVEDSKSLAANLGIDLKNISINKLYDSYLEVLADSFKGTKKGTAEENIQARIRGDIIMAISNKFGFMVLTAGNKSELAVGYCTLYGDMSGGLSVLADLPKTLVYELAEYINRDEEFIPQLIIDKPPSAELKAGQKDQDTLPPYEILDKILYYYIEKSLSLQEIVEKGFEYQVVKKVIDLVDRNEYKRRQAPPVLKVTSKAFGMGRRIPIAARS